MDDRKLGISCMTVITLSILGLVGYLSHNETEIPQGVWTILGVSVGSIPAIVKSVKNKISSRV